MPLPASTTGATGTIHRRDLGNRALGMMVGVAAAVLVAWALALPALPSPLREPGAPLLQSMAIAGSLLLLVSVAFVAVKRTGRGGSPVTWFAAHVTCATLGTVLVVIHASGRLGRPPALLLVGLLALVVLGVWARLRLPARIASTFGTKRRAFAPGSAVVRARLAAVLAEKQALLAELDPDASEATFSVTPRHWLRRPRLARAYARLAATEARLMGQRASVGPAQAWWRALHIGVAALVVLGLLVHVATVTFFAGWVADGRAIHWWHLTAW